MWARRETHLVTRNDVDQQHRLMGRSVILSCTYRAHLAPSDMRSNERRAQAAPVVTKRLQGVAPWVKEEGGMAQHGKLCARRWCPCMGNVDVNFAISGGGVHTYYAPAYNTHVPAIPLTRSSPCIVRASSASLPDAWLQPWECCIKRSL